MILFWLFFLFTFFSITHTLKFKFLSEKFSLKKKVNIYLISSTLVEIKKEKMTKK